jgi:hypothetical protein
MSTMPSRKYVQIYKEFIASLSPKQRKSAESFCLDLQRNGVDQRGAIVETLDLIPIEELRPRSKDFRNALDEALAEERLGEEERQKFYTQYVPEIARQLARLNAVLERIATAHEPEVARTASGAEIVAPE